MGKSYTDPLEYPPLWPWGGEPNRKADDPLAVPRGRDAVNQSDERGRAYQILARLRRILFHLSPERTTSLAHELEDLVKRLEL